MCSTNLSRNTGHGLLNWSLNIRSSSEMGIIPFETTTQMSISPTFVPGFSLHDFHIWHQASVNSSGRRPMDSAAFSRKRSMQVSRDLQGWGGNFFMVHSKVDGWMLDRDSKHEWNQRDFHKGSQSFMLFSARFAQRISFFRGKSDGISHDVLKYEIFYQT